MASSAASAIEYEGAAASLNHKPLTAAALAGLLTPVLWPASTWSTRRWPRANTASTVAETVHDRASEYQTLIRISVTTDKGERAPWPARCSPATSRAWWKSRAFPWKPISRRHMLYVTNQDKPGFIGKFGETLARHGINIATFHLGRAAAGGDAICLVSVDDDVPETVLAEVRALPLVVQASGMSF